MNIKIGEKYRIVTDTYNFILQEISRSTNQKTGVVSMVWGNNKYYLELSQALGAVLRHELRKSEADSIKSLHGDLLRCEGMIRDVVKAVT